MKKITKAITAILEIIKNPWLLNKILSDDTVWNRKLLKKYNITNGLPVIDLNQICSNYTETLECFSFLDGGSLPTDIALLKSLSKKFDNCKYFEIGTWRGESVINVADIAEECYTLNLSNKDLHSLGLNSKYISLIEFFSKKNKKITHLKGDSLTFDFNSIGKKFDLIFIDGNHHYDYIKNDTEKIFKHLFKDTSIIVWHDYAYTPEKLRPEVLLAILDGTPAKYHKNLYHVSNTMCAVFIKEDFSTQKFTPPIIPSKTFKIKIESLKI